MYTLDSGQIAVKQSVILDWTHCSMVEDDLTRSREEKLNVYMVR